LEGRNKNKGKGSVEQAMREALRLLRGARFLSRTLYGICRMKEIIENIINKGIKFIVIGSYSKFWNKIGTTYPKDLDLWVESNKLNFEFFQTEYQITLNSSNIGEIKIGSIKINIFTNVTGLDFDKSYQNANTRIVKSNHSLKYLCKEDYLRNIKQTNTKWDF